MPTTLLDEMREQFRRLGAAQQELEKLRTPLRQALQRGELCEATQAMAQRFPTLALVAYDWDEGGILVLVRLLDRDGKPVADLNNPDLWPLLDAFPVLDSDTPRADLTTQAPHVGHFPAVFDVDDLAAHLTTLTA